MKISRLSIRSAFFGCLLAAVLAAILAPFTQAAVVYTFEESFSSPQGGLPAGWNARWTSSGGLGDSTLAIEEVTSGEGDWRLVLRRDNASSQMVFYTGSRGPVQNGVFANFESSVIIRPASYSPGYIKGIIGRATMLTDSVNSIYFNGYYAYISGTTINISIDPKAGALNGTLLKTGNLSSPLELNMDYQFNFSADRDQLTASIYGKDSATGEFTIKLGDVSTSDATYSEGLFGFRNQPDGNTRRAYFSDLEINVIPEPSVVWLGLAGGGLLGLLQFRRKRGTGAA